MSATHGNSTALKNGLRAGNKPKMKREFKIFVTLVATIVLSVYAYWLATFNIETSPTHEQKVTGWISVGVIVAVGLIIMWRQSRGKPLIR